MRVSPRKPFPFIPVIRLGTPSIREFENSSVLFVHIFTFALLLFLLFTAAYFSSLLVVCGHEIFIYTHENSHFDFCKNTFHGERERE